MEIRTLEKYQGNLHFLIIGKPGTGKTYSLLTLPRPLLIVDAEGGLSTLNRSGADTAGIDYVNVTDFDELDALLRSDIPDRYASLAIDTYSTLQSFHVLKKSLHLNRESLPWAEWNFVLLSLKNLFYTMRKRPVTLVVNVHERLERENLVPLLQGQSASEVFNYVDYAFRAVYIDGKYLWRIRSETEPLKFRGVPPEADYIPQDYNALIKYINKARK